jgi:hypothetical protein
MVHPPCINADDDQMESSTPTDAADDSPRIRTLGLDMADSREIERRWWEVKEDGTGSDMY